MADDVTSRVRRFRTELKQEQQQSLRLGRWNYRAAYVLTIVAVICSAAAGILGLGWDIDQRIVALLALVPAIAVTVSSQFKWQDKANWHYRKHVEARAMLRRIDYELPAFPTEAQLADLVRGYSLKEKELNDSWEQDLRFEMAAEEAEAEADEGAATEGEEGGAD